MSNIEKIRQEIERRIKFNKSLADAAAEKNLHQTMEANELLVRQYESLLSFIDSLPEDASCTYDTNELTPTPSVNIEDVARVQFASHAHVFDHKRKAVFDWEHFKEVAGIFYGFGKRDSLPEDDHFRDSTKMVSEDLEKAADSHIRKKVDAAGHPGWDWTTRDIEDAFIAGAKWMESQMPMPEDTVIFMKGVEEGRRLEREDRNNDKLPRFYGD